MDERNSDSLERSFAFFILNALKEGPLSESDVARRIGRTRALLEFAAARKGKRNLSSLTSTLRHLAHTGLLNVEPRGNEPSVVSEIYSLTLAGKQQLDDEWTRHQSTLAGFIENGSLEKSFRTFLDRSGSAAAS